MFTFLVLAFFVCQLLLTAHAYELTYVGNFTAKDCAFVEILELTPGNLSLGISAFTGNPFASVGVYLVPDIAAALKAGVANIQPELIAGTGAFKWPNLFQVAPAGIFSEPTVVVFDGFLVPGKDDGGVYLLPESAKGPIMISTPKAGWFYHMGKFIDMNNDGKLDLLTARATKPLFSAPGGELLWLEQPDGAIKAIPWAEHVLLEGPDVMFVADHFVGQQDTLEVFAAEFFSHQALTLTQINLTNASVMFNRTVDATCGPLEGISVVDLNSDGKKQLLINNHNSPAANTALYAYAFPANGDILNGNYTRHTLASDFPINEKGMFGSASPGIPYAVYPKTSDTTTPPLILVAGDGAQMAYAFQRLGPFFYPSPESSVFINPKGTIGMIKTYDVNKDGFLELFIPDYTNSKVHVFTYGTI